MSEWISVDDRLPEDDEQVLVFARPLKLYPSENGRGLVDTMICLGGDLWIHDWERQPKVTHWMPLPDPPVEVTK